MKKVLAFVLVIAFVSLIFSSCAGNGEFEKDEQRPFIGETYFQESLKPDRPSKDVETKDFVEVFFYKDKFVLSQGYKTKERVYQYDKAYNNYSSVEIPYSYNVERNSFRISQPTGGLDEGQNAFVRGLKGIAYNKEANTVIVVLQDNSTVTLMPKEK